MTARILLTVLAATAALLTPPAPAHSSPDARVVVAVIDSATNPYHEWFHAGGPLYPNAAPSSVTPEVLAEFGIDDSHIIRLTRTGNFAADFAKDRAQFDAVRDGEPYWFEGTNIIGIALNRLDGQRLRPDGDESTHGVGVSAAVLAANPEAIVVMVQADSYDVTRLGMNVNAEQWAFNHPAVDIVTTSYGWPDSFGQGYHLADGYDGVVSNGKLHLGASDNSPRPAPTDATAGPWWSIGISGYAEGGDASRESNSGLLPDFVGDFTQELPYCRECEQGTEEISGTSFATPRAAGTAAKVLLEARRAAGHVGGIDTAGAAPSMVRAGGQDITNWEIRRALEEAAYYPRAEDAQSNADYGWGAITPDPAHGVVAEALAHLGVAGTPTRRKAAGTCRWMTLHIEARQAYWNGHPRSQSFAKTADPYIGC